MAQDYYVLCDDNCRYVGMTKEQIIAAIAEATGSTPTNIDSAFITQIKEQNKNNAMKIWVGTRAEFNAITPAADTLYFFPSETYALEGHDHGNITADGRIGTQSGLMLETDENGEIIAGRQIDPILNNKEQKAIRAFDITVEPSAWVIDTTYEAFAYRAAVPVNGATESMIPDVIFSVPDAVSGNLAPGGTAYDGGVYIYAGTIPTNNITIDTLTMWKVN